ncbi:MAG: hypothetical protein K0U98_00275 [Deltaproteobacteria bacterium]|nr:hypothetical protein [Deltaproteobacteria bacterium]
MKMICQASVLALSVAMVTIWGFGQVEAQDLPLSDLSQWHQYATENGSYQVGVDLVDGSPVVQLRSNRKRASGFGTQMKTISSQPYLGKQLRFTAELRTEDVKKWAGLWMRVDSRRIRSLAFENMRDRPIRGTTDWAEYEIVLPVAPNSSSISFGVLLNASGTVVMRNTRLEAVEEDFALEAGR